MAAPDVALKRELGLDREVSPLLRDIQIMELVKDEEHGFPKLVF